MLPFRIPFVVFSLLLCLAHCQSLHTLALSWERSRSQIHIKKIEAAGYQWTYAETKTQGEPLIAIHGFGGDKDHWTRFARHLGEGYHMIAPDLPGFGETSKLEGESYTIESQVKRLHSFLETFGLKSYHLVGNSMGGSIAGMYAATYPEKVKSLVLVDSAGVKSPIPSKMLEMEKLGNPSPLLIQSEEDFDRFLEFSFGSPPYIPGPIKGTYAKRAVKNRPWNEMILNQIRKEGNLLENNLNKIKCPTLVIWGAKDNIIHVSSVEVFEKRIPIPIQKKIFPDVGHAPMIEVPKETATSIREFHSGLSPKL